MVNNRQCTQLFYDHVTKSSEAMFLSENAAQPLLSGVQKLQQELQNLRHCRQP